MPDTLTYFAADDVHAPPPTATIRKRATAEEILADLHDRIARLVARDPKFAGCEIAFPRPIPARTDGAPNWTVAGFPGLASGCYTTLVKIVDQARLEYELVA